MQRAIDETTRRRKLQEAYNEKHGITPETIKKAIHRGIEATAAAHAQANAAVGRTEETKYITEEYIAELEAEMLAAADGLEFERAAAIRDRIEKMQDAIGEPVDSIKGKTGSEGRKGHRGNKKSSGKVPRPKRGV
jgi:excinuclease ABC subunit B